MHPAGTRLETIHLRTLRAAIPLLAIAALPDALVVPVLKGLLVDRYGVSVGAAHWFLGVNVLGGALAAVALRRLGRRAGGRTPVAVACLLNAILLAGMALPVGFGPTLILRFFEGGADLFVYAALFHLAARSGPVEARGRRLGCAATCMMLGIAAGVGIGGVVGAVQPVLTLWSGAIVCVIGGAMAITLLPRRAPRRRSPEALSRPDQPPERAWPAMAMHGADRGIGGMMAVTAPLGLSVSLGYGPVATGAVVGAAMLALALGVWPAGQVADRVGWRRMRGVAAAVHLVALATLVPAAEVGPLAAAGVVAMLGLAAAGLFAASLTLIGRQGPGAMGLYHAAGSAGFLAVPLAAAGALAILGGRTPSAEALAWVLGATALLHGLVTLVVFAATGRTMRVREAVRARSATDRRRRAATRAA